MDGLNFLDLIVLRRLEQGSTVENFGSHINTSFFETANLLGTMKAKGLLDLHPSIGGGSEIDKTGEGMDMLAEAERYAQTELDYFDEKILGLLAGGTNELEALRAGLNIRSKDLALHLWKLKEKDYVDYTVEMSKVSLFLTEKGFNFVGKIKGERGMAPVAPRVPAEGVTAATAPSEEGAPVSPPAAPVAVPPVTGGPLPTPAMETAFAPAAPFAKEQTAVTAQQPKNIKWERRKTKLTHYLDRYGPYIVMLILLVLLALATIYLGVL